MVNNGFLASSIMLVFLPALAFGHGFLYEPRARNVIHNSDLCPHCLQLGGPEYVSGQHTLTWPAGNRGVCGDMAGSNKHEPGGVYGPAGIQATYTSGQDITISLLLTTQHGGRHMFRLCDRADADEACFAAHVLERSDGAGPYTWTPREPAKGPSIPSSDYSTGTLIGQVGETYSMQYRLPAGVSCAECTLQWYWTTSNSCDIPGDPFGETIMNSCDTPQPSSYPEEFINCADISILGSGGDPAIDPASITPEVTLHSEAVVGDAALPAAQVQPAEQVPEEIPVPAEVLPVEQVPEEIPVPAEVLPAEQIPVEAPAPAQVLPVEQVPEEIPVPAEVLPAEQMPVEAPAPAQVLPAEQVPEEIPVPAEVLPTEQVPEEIPAPAEVLPAEQMPVEAPAPAQVLPAEQVPEENPVPAEVLPTEQVPEEIPAPAEVLPAEQMPVEAPAPAQVLPAEQVPEEIPVPADEQPAEQVPEEIPVPAEVLSAEQVPEEIPVPAEELPAEQVSEEVPLTELVDPALAPASAFSSKSGGGCTDEVGNCEEYVDQAASDSAPAPTPAAAPSGSPALAPGVDAGAIPEDSQVPPSSPGIPAHLFVPRKLLFGN